MFLFLFVIITLPHKTISHIFNIVSYPTATSVSISWTPNDTLSMHTYLVLLEKANDASQFSCDSSIDSKSESTRFNFMRFTNLHEFSLYQVTISIISLQFSSLTNFSTLSAVSTGTPQDLIYSVTTRNITIYWSPIECTERNGHITQYIVKFSRTNETNVTVAMVPATSQNFSVNELMPYTVYVFQVAGVNVNGTGPFSRPINVLTGGEVRAQHSSALYIVSCIATVIAFIVIVLVSIHVIRKLRHHIALTRTAAASDTTQKEGPVITKFPENMIVQEGDTLQFQVAVRGNPKPVLSWYFKGEKLTSSDVLEIKINGNLSLNPVQTKHTGEYMFVAKNNRGTAKNHVTLFVIGIGVTAEKDLHGKEMKGSMRGSNITITTEYLSSGSSRVSSFKPDDQISRDMSRISSRIGNFEQISSDNLKIEPNDTSRISKTGNFKAEEKDISSQKKVNLKPEEHISGDHNDILIMAFKKYVMDNRALNNAGFKAQYLALDSGDEHPATIGRAKENMELNRFPKVVVYDHNRIILNQFKQFKQRYINACYINGYSQPKRFIVTQGPKMNTLIDFWQMIWQEKPPIIVMLTQLKEGNQTKSQQYWPDEGSTNYGPFTVTLKERITLIDYVARTLEVQVEVSMGISETFELKQYQFLSWPKQSLPTYPTYMPFLKKVISQHNDSTGPMLVHCSSGVGRTAVFVCIDIAMKQIQMEHKVNIIGIINNLRHQHMWMIQSLDHYIFIHAILLKYLEHNDSEMAQSRTVQYARSRSSKVAI